MIPDSGQIRLKRIALRFLVAYTVVCASLLLTPVHIRRHDFDRAFVAWYKNPSEQNAAVLRNEKYRNRLVWYSTAAGLAIIVVVAACSGYWVSRRVMDSSSES